MIRPYYDAPVDLKGSVSMRGDDPRNESMFSYVTPETRVRPDHPLRPIRRMTDAALAQLSTRFDRLYDDRPTVDPARAAAACVAAADSVQRSQ
jgi:hypothetical protein